MNHLYSVLLVVFVFTFSWSVNASEEVNTINKLNELASNNSPPTLFERKQTGEGSDSLYFAGEPYQGKPTRIFAYYDTPKGKGPFPAIVLVHGGGGSAYQTWVKKWNDAGFAAISIAVEGQTGEQINKRPPNKWQKHQWAGPRRPGIYNDDDKPLTEQWMYHATSAVIKAHNLLRSFDEINPGQIGVSGISWGGVITSTVIGFDQRFAFAIPIYGSGFLDSMDNHYGEALKDNRSYRNVWEPALRIAKFKQPTLWLTGLKENNFSLDAQANTYLLLKTHYQSIQPELKHSHPAGWAPKEPYTFARAVIDVDKLPSFDNQSVSAGSVRTEVSNVDKISSATLFYTFDVGHTLTRTWKQHPAQISDLGNQLKLSAPLPKSVTAWLFNIEKDGLIYSSEFSENATRTEHKLK